jgi:hypothetical protein
MYADASPNVFFTRGGGDNLVPFSQFGRDVQEALDTCIARAAQNGLLFLDQTLIFEVAMAID